MRAANVPDASAQPSAGNAPEQPAASAQPAGQPAERRTGSSGSARDGDRWFARQHRGGFIAPSIVAGGPAATPATCTASAVSHKQTLVAPASAIACKAARSRLQTHLSCTTLSCPGPPLTFGGCRDSTACAHSTRCCAGKQRLHERRTQRPQESEGRQHRRARPARGGVLRRRAAHPRGPAAHLRHRRAGGELQRRPIRRRHHDRGQPDDQLRRAHHRCRPASLAAAPSQPRSTSAQHSDP